MQHSEYPSWLAGCRPPNPNAKSNGHFVDRRRYASGGLQLRKSRGDDSERKPIMQVFIDQLDRALVDRARELKELDDKQPLSLELIALITNFFRLVITSSDGTTLHTAPTPLTTLIYAKALSKPLKNFKVNIERLVPATEVGLMLCTVLDELIGDVEHFIRSIKITHGIVKVDQGKPIMRNRPSNTTGMAAYAGIVNEYQQQHGPEEFPKPRVAFNQMVALGHAVSERTLRDWKLQMKNDTFGDFVQNRNGNN